MPESIFWYKPGAYFIVSGDIFSADGEITTFNAGVTFNREGTELPPIGPEYPESYYSCDLKFMGYTYPKPVGE